MSDEDGRPFRKRERVTLRFSADPLLLPGERPSQAPKGEADELRLPGEVEGDAAPALPEAEDAWSRQRPGSRPPSQPALKLDDGVEEAGALELVARRSRPASPTIDLTEEMRDRYALGDYTAALRVAELLLGRHEGHAEATKISESCREKLASLHGSRLGSLERMPSVGVQDEEIRWLGLDHRAGFLLSRVDGEHSLEELIDVSGMPRLDALRTLVELLDMGAIRFDD